MPQFDTFSFLSQLFWVFLIFGLFYTALSYYLLPAIAITLKIRKKKLLVSSSSSNDVIVKSGSDFSVNFVNTSFDSIFSNSKSMSVVSDQSAKVRKSIESVMVNKLILKRFATTLATKFTSLILHR